MEEAAHTAAVVGNYLPGKSEWVGQNIRKTTRQGPNYGLPWLNRQKYGYSLKGWRGRELR